MKSGRTSSPEISAAKFNSLTLSENKVILTNAKKEDVSISYSDLSKIYIRKKRFGFLTKLGFSLLLLFLIFCFNLFLPNEITLAAVIVLFFPLFFWMSIYQWYQLNLIQNNGAFFKKAFPKKKKQEYINLVNRVRDSIFENHINSSN